MVVKTYEKSYYENGGQNLNPTIMVVNSKSHDNGGQK